MTEVFSDFESFRKDFAFFLVFALEVAKPCKFMLFVEKKDELGWNLSLLILGEIRFAMFQIRNY